MPVQDNRLIIFTRYPAPGLTKTRLNGSLGPNGAADLHRQMTEYTARWAKTLCGDCANVEVHHEGGTSAEMTRWLGKGFVYRAQCDGDLGARMMHALEHSLRGSNCARHTIIVGIDCPGLSEEIARRAFQALEQHDIVLGPAADGGYYLIGLKRPARELFDSMPWSTDQVLQETIQRAAELRYSVYLLEELSDVDTPIDLPVWKNAIRQVEQTDLSVIIPTLDEAGNTATLVDDMRLAGAEVIVADGGSTDGTADIARKHAAIVVTSSPGRAIQMNAGARAATRGTLLFLHADTRLPWDFPDHVTAALARPGVVAGAFRFRIDTKSIAARIIEFGTNVRCRSRHMPYGDQGLFLRREVFHSIGGFEEIPIMEDFELVSRLRPQGRIAVIAAPAFTSPRRWERLGYFRTTLCNKAVIWGYRLGIPPQRLTQWYRR